MKDFKANRLAVLLVVSLVHAWSSAGRGMAAPESVSEKPTSALAKRIDSYLQSEESPIQVLERARAHAEEFEDAIAAGDEPRAAELLNSIKRLDLRSRGGINDIHQFDQAMERQLATLRRESWMKEKGRPLIAEARRLCSNLETPLPDLLALETRLGEAEQVLSGNQNEVSIVRRHLGNWIRLRQALAVGEKGLAMGEARTLSKMPDRVLLLSEDAIKQAVMAAAQIPEPAAKFMESLQTPDDLVAVITQVGTLSNPEARALNAELTSLLRIQRSLKLGKVAEAALEVAQFSQQSEYPAVTKIFDALRHDVYQAVFAEHDLAPNESEATMAFAQRALAELIKREGGWEDASNILRNLQRTPVVHQEDARWLYNEAQLIQGILSAMRVEKAGDDLYAIYLYRKALDGGNTSRIGLVEIASERLEKLVKEKPELAKATDSIVLQRLEAIQDELEQLKRMRVRSR